MAQILGRHSATAAQLLAFAEGSPPPSPPWPGWDVIVALYLDEGAAEGVDGALAFMQGWLETAAWRFGGDVSPAQFNPAGIGATGAGAGGAWFPDARTGIRAQIQHLHRYATWAPLHGPSVDPRQSGPQPGSCPTWESLDGHWAVPGIGYAESIVALRDQAVRGAPLTDSPLADRFVQASYYSSAPNGDVTRIVIHGTVSPCERGGAVNVANYFAGSGPGGSAQYIVDTTEVVQCVAEGETAFHAPPNQGSIGIELCDTQAGDPARWGDADHQAMLVLAARLTADVAARHGVPLVRIGAAQLVAGARGICGHIDVSAAFHQTDHADPDDAGPFPWDQFMALVTGHATATTPTQGDDVPAPTDVTAVLVPPPGHPDFGSEWRMKANGEIDTITGPRFYGAYPQLTGQLGDRGIFVALTIRPDGKAGYVQTDSHGESYTFGP